ncbi:MAG: hypothetical protein R3Y09_00070 [Clostridia bacterium]
MKNKFTESSYCNDLYGVLLHSHRRTGHALDNYGVDMPQELKEALEGLYEAHRAVMDIMKSELNEQKAEE